MKVVVSGSRDWVERDVIYEALEKLPPGTIIIEGGCRSRDEEGKIIPIGADYFAHEIGNLLGHTVRTMNADWKRHGKSAGPIRNSQMLAEKPDKVLAFRLDRSPGTTDCIRKAIKLGIDVEIVDRFRFRYSLF